MAVASIAAAVRGLNLSEWSTVLSTLAGAMNLDPRSLMPVLEQIELVVENETAVLPQSEHDQQQLLQQQSSTPTNKQPPTMPMEFDINDTPKDLTDIHF